MIITKNPTRYEKTMDGLNQVPVLELQPAVRQGLGLPVGSEHSVIESPSVSGKFIRCNNHSVLLRAKNSQAMALAVDSDQTLYFQDEDTSYDFGQVVDRVLVRWKFLTATAGNFLWLTSTGLEIKLISDAGMYWYEFKGQVFYWKTTNTDGVYGVTFFGFTFN